MRLQSLSLLCVCLSLSLRYVGGGGIFVVALRLRFLRFFSVRVRNGESCPPSSSSSVCDPGLVHIAMTLDSHYLRGSMAAVLSLLTHAACPDALFFHFLLLNHNHSTTLAASFPSLRAGHYRSRIHSWMALQKDKRIYDLGSLPPFLLVFAGDIQPVHHRWNQHGLGGDNVHGSCRPLHPGPVSLMHWSGKGKPWDRLDAARPCPMDLLWAPYDLYVTPHSSSSSSSSSPSPLYSW
ncbi:Hexosyltransferase [Rhynchospora pubera]|uniref:Hexosyltransferase n=1 Tax=Rhynchospora pubera TaxID=906938 RepID=A0AAV8CMA3_9POAL|nr:Hexosyltransferase [Rhynchospora pubera]